MRSLSSSVVILMGLLVLWAVPAHGQIVSYKDTDGKRVFVNAEPAPTVRTPKTPLLRTAANGSRSAQPKRRWKRLPYCPLPSRPIGEDRGNDSRGFRSLSRGPGAGACRDPDGIELEQRAPFPEKARLGLCNSFREPRSSWA
jgi:hypothetical protein